MPTCALESCDLKAVSLGYCDRHYRWTKKGWLDPSSNTVTELCRAKAHYDQCKVERCLEEKGLKHGLCGKHYRQYRRGAIDLEGQSLRPLRRARYGLSDKCKVSGCKTRPRRLGFCTKHAQKYAAGHLTAKGEPNPEYERKNRQYNRDWACAACGRVGSPAYILGFCRTPCYTRFRTGIIDFYGNPLREMRVRYLPGTLCKAEGCTKKAVCKSMCASHAQSLRRGTMSPQGKRLLIKAKNKGRLCLVCGERPARNKGLCVLHHTRLVESGEAYIERKDNPNWKNVGKKCSVPECDQNARCLSLCSKHYSRHKKNQSLDDRLFFKNKGQTCLECEKPARKRGRCGRHYSRFLIALKN